MEDPNQGSSTSSGRRTRRRNREIETLSLEIKNSPRDLLHTFLSTDPNLKRQSIEEEEEEEEEGEDEEMEFNLGLSLGGRFGVDKSHRGLIKSSSIAGELPCSREGGEEEVAPPPTPAAALARASSLPSVTEVECRRRKATLRRMEAKRRRSEKQRGVKENSGAGEERERPGKLNPGHGLPGPGFQGKGGFFRSLQGLLAHQQQQQQRSQGSGESQGGGVGSSGESKTHQQGSGGGSGGEAKSPASTQSMQMQERGSQESPMGLSSGTECGEGSSKQPETPDDRKKEAGNSKVENMPSVFTIGDGPNGRKVEGILYKYGKGEEARIMCVCHGSFFTPAEFVKHSGGRDVDHPLRHIVVNPSSTAFH